MPKNKYTSYFLDAYPKLLVNRIRRELAESDIKILKSGIYIDGMLRRVHPRSDTIRYIFALVQLPYITPEKAHKLYTVKQVGRAYRTPTKQSLGRLLGREYKKKLPIYVVRGGIGEERPLPKKLIINPELKAFLDARLSNVAAAIKGQPALVKEPKVRIKEEDIPIAPPLAPPLTPALSPIMTHQMQQYQIAPQQHNFLQELKEYKDSIEYIRGICPLLRREYKKREKKEPQNYSKRMLQALQRMKEADRRLLMRKY